MWKSVFKCFQFLATLLFFRKQKLAQYLVRLLANTLNVQKVGTALNKASSLLLMKLLYPRSVHHDQAMYFAHLQQEKDNIQFIRRNLTEEKFGVSLSHAGQNMRAVSVLQGPVGAYCLHHVSEGSRHFLEGHCVTAEKLHARGWDTQQLS